MTCPVGSLCTVSRHGSVDRMARSPYRVGRRGVHPVSGPRGRGAHTTGVVHTTRPFFIEQSPDQRSLVAALVHAVTHPCTHRPQGVAVGPSNPVHSRQSRRVVEETKKAEIAGLPGLSLTP